jgi:hypothetical protein
MQCLKPVGAPSPATKAAGPGGGGDVVDQRRRSTVLASDSSPAAPRAGSRAARIETKGYPQLRAVECIHAVSSQSEL